MTILHVSDPQFGAHHRFGDGEHDSLAGRLLQQWSVLAEGLPPVDLAVLSGDITETGMPGEFTQARAFIDRLGEALGVDHDHFVVVPGNHDINRKLCRSYFDEEEGNGREPLPPFAKKWDPYQAFVTDLHDLGDFSPDRPYRLHVFDELDVVVAALNSTIAESHLDRDHYGHCGEDQLRWFERELSLYANCLRIGVVHHNVRRKAADDDENLRDADLLTQVLGPHLDLVLHGHTHDGKQDRLADGTLVLATGSAAVEREQRDPEVPNQCQLLHVRPDGLTRWAWRYQPSNHRWEGDTSLSATGRDWTEEIPFHGPAQPSDAREQGFELTLPLWRSDPNFAFEVAAVTRLRDDVRQVDIRSKEGFDYLAVYWESGEMSAVGVVDGSFDAVVLEAFCAQVHAPIRSRTPGARSELVHTGRAADHELRRRAGLAGVVVKSWAEYQNLLDLSAYEDALRRRLAADDLYPQDLYLSQRHRVVDRYGAAGNEIEDDLDQSVLGELLDGGARFTLVLGDPGFGKSFLVRRLTHLLLEGDSGITPIVVLLRDAEKRHTLEEMVADALISTDAKIQRDKFRRMFTGGRVVLLVDGYDEFAVRAGYDRAAEQLRTFLQAIEGDAKILLTTRPSHFRSHEQVISQIFEDVLALDSQQRRVYELEAFDEHQQAAFLQRWFSLRGGDDPASLAAEWMAALGAVDNLPELARTPRMLSFMAQHLSLGDIRAASREGGPVTAAGLYRMLVDTWLANETAKFGGERVGAGDERQLQPEHRWAVAEELAFRLWTTSEVYVSETLLEGVAGDVLNLPEFGMSVSQAAQEIGSRTLLVGDGDERYFAHQSIFEFLLACRLAKVLESADEPPEMGHAELSELTARFLRDLAPDAGTRWLQTMAKRPD